MVKRLIWTNRYYGSLRSIALNAGDIYSKGIVRLLRAEIKRKCELLKHNSLMGSLEPALFGMKYEYRFLLVKPYFKIIYRIENETIFIITVWDTRRAPERLMRYLTS